MEIDGEVRCLVVGNGAVGTAIASRLQILDFRCQFVGRKGPVYIKSRFEGWGQITYLKIKPLSEEDLSRVNLAFITVKAYDLGGALERYLPYLPKGIPVIPLSNGAVESVVAKIAKKFPYYLWRIGICNFGVSHVSDGIYCLKSGKGGVYWGPLRALERKKQQNFEITDTEKKILSADSGQFLNWNEDILPVTRRKWLFNVVINSLAASKGLEKNGLLLNDMNQLKETFDEAYRLGVEMWGGWQNSYDKLLEEMVCLISATSENENSMVRDLRLSRRTENDYLAGLSEGRRNYEILNTLSREITVSSGQGRGRGRGRREKDS